jgi:hypothetical protein
VGRFSGHQTAETLLGLSGDFAVETPGPSDRSPRMTLQT